jgi:beta-glucuronidase
MLNALLTYTVYFHGSDSGGSMRNLIGRALFLVVAVVVLRVPSPAQLVNLSNRPAISLDGTWNTTVDPYESGLQARYFQNPKPKAKSDLIEFDFAASPKLHVPGDWNTQRESLFFYEGPLWYQRNFSYQRRARTRTFLCFGAANYLARVWLNGSKLGEHAGGFTPFSFEVTDALTDGENNLVVEVNNTRRADGVPGLRTDWWNYGGLTRSVQLVEVPQTFISDVSVQLSKNSPGEIEGWVQVNGGQQGSEVTIEIPDAHLKQTGRLDSAGRATFNMQAKLVLWSADNPKLYRVIVTAGGDTVTDEIGFRTITTRGTQILLNGKPIFLRGICLHEEAPFRSGRAFSEEDDRTLLTWAKNLGANFVRLAHYPHNEKMIRLADQMGLLVWDEVPVYWDLQFDNPATLENAKSQLREMIARDHNRAAVAMWSLSNETPISPERNAFLKEMASYARQLDPTRLITSASDKAEHPGPQTSALNDPLGEFLDVIGLNEYIGWYGNLRPEDADKMKWSFAYAKPVIVSEFGADAAFGFHADAQTRFSEEYQANLFEHQIAMLKRMPALAGVSPWLLMDFHSPRRPLPGIQDYFNRKGLISDRGQRKQAFYVLQKFYREKEQESRAASNSH